MGKWEMVRLGDVCTIVSGTTPKSSVSDYWDGTYNWVTPAELSVDSELIFDTQRKITEAGIRNSSLRPFPAGTVLLSSRAPIGKVAIAGREMYCNQGFKNFICSSSIYNKYLFWFLKGKNEYLNSLGRGATFKEISKSIVENIEIPLPPLEIQQKIATTLDTAAALLKLHQQQLAELEALIQSVFYQMFGDPVRNEKGWESVPLGELCTIVRGGSPRPIMNFLGGTVPWIKIGDATKGDEVYLRATKEHIIEEGIKKSRYIKKGSLIFANCGVSLGFARIITFDGCIHDGWLAFQDIDERLDKIFLLKSLNMCTDYFRRTAPDGTQPNLNTEIMKNFVQFLPPKAEQVKFVKKLKQISELKLLIRKSVLEFNEQFNALMQKYYG